MLAGLCPSTAHPILEALSQPPRPAPVPHAASRPPVAGGAVAAVARTKACANILCWHMPSCGLLPPQHRQPPDKYRSLFVVSLSVGSTDPVVSVLSCFVLRCCFRALVLIISVVPVSWSRVPSRPSKVIFQKMEVFPACTPGFPQQKNKKQKNKQTILAQTFDMIEAFSASRADGRTKCLPHSIPR